MATRETKLPSIPDIPDRLNEDLRAFLSSIKEIIEIREGRRAEKLDKILIRKDLSKIGINVSALDSDNPSYDLSDYLLPLSVTTATWDPASIADGDEEAKEVTVTGAVLTDFAIASFSLDVEDLVLDAEVTAANKVTCVLANNTGGAIDLGEGTLYIKLFKNKNR